MRQKKLRTFQAKRNGVERSWYIVDASNQTLGRMATRVATVLMGKHKPTYTSHVDTGDFVVVTNADKVKVTGKKSETKSYARYSYYPGGYTEISYDRMMKDHPDRIIRFAVQRMLPKSALGRHMLKKLKVYASNEHPHTAQSPEPLPMA